MVETGLVYLQLVQPASSFSGGEAQRVKLAKELSSRSPGRTLYLLDEPTTCLHPEDVRRLLQRPHWLVDRCNSVFVVDHYLELVKCADWVIDLGPGGGEEGGSVVAVGTPEEVAECKESVTGRMLKAHFIQREAHEEHEDWNRDRRSSRRGWDRSRLQD